MLLHGKWELVVTDGGRVVGSVDVEALVQAAHNKKCFLQTQHTRKNKGA